MGDTEAMMEKEKEVMMGENGAVISPEESKPVKKLDADKIYRIIGSTGIDIFLILIRVFSCRCAENCSLRNQSKGSWSHSNLSLVKSLNTSKELISLMGSFTFACEFYLLNFGKFTELNHWPESLLMRLRVSLQVTLSILEFITGSSAFGGSRKKWSNCSIATDGQDW